MGLDVWISHAHSASAPATLQTNTCSVKHPQRPISLAPHSPTPAPSPGQPGNFALAGHRTANGEPFADIDELAAGDVVIVRTRHATYRYRLIDDVVVEPDETWVIGDVTGRLDLQANSSVISLITCSPKWSTDKRWVWWGSLVDEA